jgi:hypothetical protein
MISARKPAGSVGPAITAVLQGLTCFAVWSEIDTAALLVLGSNIVVIKRAIAIRARFVTV